MNIGRMIINSILALILVGCATTKDDWKKAQDLGTIQSYEEFLTKYPKSGFSNNAKADIEKLYWQKAKNDNTIEAYRNFLERNPQTFSRDARIAMIDLAWGIALKQNTIEGYLAFKSEYPDSDYSSNADRKIQKLKWNNVRRMNRKEEYERFLISYPNSEYSYEATLRASVADLKITKTDKPQIMSSGHPKLSNLFPDIEVVPPKNHVFIIVKWSFLPIRNFTINSDEIGFFGSDNDYIAGTYETSGGHWYPTQNIVDKILRSKNLTGFLSSSMFVRFLRNRQQNLNYLFVVPLYIVKGSKVSIGKVDFFVDNYINP